MNNRFNLSITDKNWNKNISLKHNEIHEGRQVGNIYVINRSYNAIIRITMIKYHLSYGEMMELYEINELDMKACDNKAGRMLLE